MNTWKVIVWLFLINVVVGLTGCGSTGWRVSFGVSPVTAISDTQTLTQAEERK